MHFPIVGCVGYVCLHSLLDEWRMRIMQRFGWSMSLAQECCATIVESFIIFSSSDGIMDHGCLRLLHHPTVLGSSYAVPYACKTAQRSSEAGRIHITILLFCTANIEQRFEYHSAINLLKIPSHPVCLMRHFSYVRYTSECACISLHLNFHWYVT